MLPYHSADVPGIMDEGSPDDYGCPVNHHHHYLKKNLVVQAGELNLVQMKKAFLEKLEDIQLQQTLILERKNKKLKEKTGRPFDRYKFPVLTSDHIPLSWRYDMNEKTNPLLLERVSINAVLNPGAIKWKNKYLLMARVEGADRKSFFAIAESDHGVDGFRFWDR